MAERERYIPGVPCWVDISEPDPQAALDFYGGLFGWEFEEAMPEGSGANYFLARIRGGEVASIGSVPDGAPPVPEWNTYVAVARADDAAAAAEAAGGTVLMAPFDVLDAGRMAVLADPEGVAFCVWEAGNTVGATVVNEHGAVNFNTLATRDLDRARDFYGALFGWKTLSLPFGLVWTLPGYGDHLEELMPGVRAQMEQMGAPDGFIDVVAAVEAIGDDDDERNAHWSVTFGIDDADAIAAKAEALGAEVLHGPTDAPWTRNTVIRDPQGATFVASQFVAENSGLTT